MSPSPNSVLGGDLPGQEASPERAERDEADAELLEDRQDLLLGLAPEQGVLALQRGHRLDGVGAADGAGAGLGHPEVAHLAGLDELLDRARDVLDRDVGVDAVLVEQVDRVGAQPPQRPVDGGADVLGSAVHAAGLRAVLVEVEAELGGDDDLVAHRLERLADELLVVERAVDLGGVEERDAAVDGRAHEVDHLRARRPRPEGLAHAHAAEAER